jgi:predicted deacetylase
MIKMFETTIRRDNNDKEFLKMLKQVKNNDQRALLITNFTNKYQIDRNNRFLEDNFK